MTKKILFGAALAAIAGAALFVYQGRAVTETPSIPKGFVQVRGGKFVIDGRPFRFIGANVSVMYRDEDRERMPETLKHAANAGIRVLRVWAYGEGGTNDIGPLADFADWPRHHPFRWAPGQWNEEAFVHLDHVIAEAQRQDLLVQLCLTNWWRDTGGVTQYLRWAGINDAADENFRFGINPERAMLFYSNEITRRLYREHIEKLATRRNSVTGVLYRDDPTIFGWELMNEAQAVTGRWAERRAWVAEMSQYLKSLDPNHVVAPGIWGYRTAAERREWLADHSLPHVDYIDVHNYPRDDTDSFVDSPQALQEFLNNRVAAALSLRKPLVLGEFGMWIDGHNGFSQAEWFRAFFEGNLRAGSAGAMFWIITPDPNRGYGVTYSTDRDRAIFTEISAAAKKIEALQAANPPERLTEPGRHLVPRQFSWSRSAAEPETQPEAILRPDKTIVYRFKPQSAVSARFEKLGGGPGYFWGFGIGAVDFHIPARSDNRRVSSIVVRAHLQPVLPIDAKPEQIKTRVTLFINGRDCGSRLIPVAQPNNPLIQEWKVNSLLTRWDAMRGKPLTVRFAVTPQSDWLYGVNISNWPEGYESNDAKPLEIELRHST
ncbi:MAG TPA: cellulase family glycosylhydrolase [Pyrinomonadaceae bacterium]|nr:cellulase family glycosylhydrolase [Pyrinomonadaceae bacterium]